MSLFNSTATVASFLCLFTVFPLISLHVPIGTCKASIYFLMLQAVCTVIAARICRATRLHTKSMWRRDKSLVLVVDESWRCCSSLHTSSLCCRWPFPKRPLCKAAFRLRRYEQRQRCSLLLPTVCNVAFGFLSPTCEQHWSNIKYVNKAHSFTQRKSVWSSKEIRGKEKLTVVNCS